MEYDIEDRTNLCHVQSSSCARRKHEGKVSIHTSRKVQGGTHHGGVRIEYTCGCHLVIHPVLLAPIKSLQEE